MKTVPSLVASSTVGIAAAGLALGKPERATPVRPSSKKRKAGDLAEFDANRDGNSSPVSRPGTSSTVITPEKTVLQPTPSSNPPQTHRTRPLTSKIDAQNSSGGRRHSMVRHGDVSSLAENPEEVARRDSVSSKGSWMKRLSTIPNSYNNSPRSSVGPDSPSLTFSHGSAAPIFSNPVSSPPQLPPNKLVKRATSGRGSSGSITRSGSKSQVPTLRRPATSHQRSVTLHQQFRDDSTKDSIQQTPIRQAQTIPSSKFSTPERTTWRPFFESRYTKLTKERLSGKSADGNVQNFQSTSRRVIPDETTKPTLVKPAVITMRKSSGTAYYDEDGLMFDDDDAAVADIVNDNDVPIPSTEPQDELPKRARRSLSMHFSSPTSWISRSGSLRGTKRNIEGRGGGKRYSSAPVSTLPGRSVASAHGAVSNKPRPIMDPTVFQRQPLSPVDVSQSDPFASSFQARTRNTSSPLPPLSRLSSFNVDLARLGLSSSSSSAPRRSPTSPIMQPNTTATSISSTGRVSSNPSNYTSHNSKPSRTSQVTENTLVGSDNDTKGFASGDDDDMDFQSETVFDSLRSGATGSIRSRNTPLDSMFDESPPSLNGSSKNKRLSIHEMLGNGGFSEGHNRIVEEDEGMSTPVKGPRFSTEEGFETPVRPGTMESDNFPSSPPSFSLATKDFGRLSLDDTEDDEDWTRDEENIGIKNQLSPPSSSLNSRRVSLSFRAALADVTHSSSTNGNSAPNTDRPERPKSNLFDWSEPSSTEKLDLMGNSPRPKTAHVKQIADGRGGRTIGRRGPSALHIRSQSVPVVPDTASQREHSKLTPKFGTWGLGAKGVSEDWDNDFEFEGTGLDDGHEGDDKMESSGMLVPPAIQASQANVVGHVGQIREVCLLVEDLKRLRILAKEKDLLEGPSAPLWKEAEGIIALAVPDEEDPTLSPPHSPSSIILDKEPAIYNDDEPNAEESLRHDGPMEILHRSGRPTQFVYDSNTVRRSVFSPGDDIFGGGIQSPPTRSHLQPPTSPRPSSTRSASDVARSVMETMHQHRATSDPLLKEMASQSSNKMPFDTTSLRDLVHRASVLTRTLGDLIRKADGRSPSPETVPQRESSPAFTRVFTDPMASPPKNLPRSQSNNSILNGSIDSSPTRSLGQRMHMMTVV